MARSEDAQNDNRPVVYLAGPDVFLADAREAGRRKVGLCARYGFSGLFPLDGELDLRGLSKREQAHRIAQGNENLMRRADAIVANITPFRGASLDSGTAFEIGFMRALGKPVFLYSGSEGYFAARSAEVRLHPRPRWDCDRGPIAVEDFDLEENLMITEGAKMSGGSITVVDASEVDGHLEAVEAFEECLKVARDYFSKS